jgi:hypothetical protein
MELIVRRCLAGLAAVVAACVSGFSVVSADTGQPPVVTSLAPLLVVPNGQPLQVTLAGSGFTGVNQVFLNPAVGGRSFAVAGDTLLRLTLPADVPPGDYSVRVVSPAGASDPAAAEFTVGSAAAASAAAVAPVLPRYSFAPIPSAQNEPVTGVAGEVAPAVEPSSLHQPLSPLMLLPLGFVLGGLGYLLWGRPGRLAAAEQQGLAAHLIGRPAQALRIGRICLQCGRLHFVLKTRRDLWQAGQFCSATCFVAAQEDDSAARAGETTAVARMREMFVYSELEESLQQALAGDVHALEHAAAVGDPAIEAVLAPGS